MIVDERMVTFINSLDEGHTEFLEQLEKEAREDAVPIVRREMQSFLKFLMAAARPKRILEVGTAVGFSALPVKTVRLQKEFWTISSRTLRSQTMNVYRSVRIPVWPVFSWKSVRTYIW